MTTATIATHAHAAVTQPSALLRRPPPAVRTAPARHMDITLSGVLTENAVTSTEPATGRAAFSVLVSQGAGNPDIMATLWLGDGPEAAWFAAARAQALRVGDTVQIRGSGLRMRYRHDTLAIVVCQVRSIDPSAYAEGSS